MPDRTLQEVIIAEIKAEMARQSITQTELGRRLDWDQASVSKRLRQVVPIRTSEVEQIARVLDVPVSQFSSPFQDGPPADALPGLEVGR